MISCFYGRLNVLLPRWTLAQAGVFLSSAFYCNAISLIAGTCVCRGKTDVLSYSTKRLV